MSHAITLRRKLTPREAAADVNIPTRRGPLSLSPRRLWCLIREDVSAQTEFCCFSTSRRNWRVETRRVWQKQAVTTHWCCSEFNTRGGVEEEESRLWNYTPASASHDGFSLFSLGSLDANFLRRGAKSRVSYLIQVWDAKLRKKLLQFTLSDMRRTTLRLLSPVDAEIYLKALKKYKLMLKPHKRLILVF